MPSGYCGGCFSLLVDKPVDIFVDYPVDIIVNNYESLINFMFIGGYLKTHFGFLIHLF